LQALFYRRAAENLYIVRKEKAGKRNANKDLISKKSLGNLTKGRNNV
jgi:hypothetical protein